MPTVTYNAIGNVRASSTLAANTTTTAYTVDFSSAALGGYIGIEGTGGGTVAATNGLKISIFAATDSGPSFETVASMSITLAIVVSTRAAKSILVPCGKWTVVLQNLDVTNALSSVAITSDPIA